MKDDSSSPSPPAGRGCRARNRHPTYDELRTCVAIVESTNLSEAAVKLGCSSGAVQNRTNSLSEKLEQILGRPARLYSYDPSSRTVAPTDLGRHLYEAVRAAVRDIERLADDLAHTYRPERSLRICATESLLEGGLFDQIGAMRARDPDLQIDVLSRGSEGSLRMILEHQCHVAFVCAHTLDGARLTPRFGVRDYRALPVFLYVPVHAGPECARVLEPLRDAAAGGDDEARARALAWIAKNFRLLLPGGWSVFRRHVDAVFKECGVPLGPGRVADYDSTHAKQLAILHGFGAALVWEQGALLEPDQVVAIPLDGLFAPWRYCAVYHEGRMNEAASAFLEAACGGGGAGREG